VEMGEMVSWAEEMDRVIVDVIVVVLFLMMVDRAVLLRKWRCRDD